MSASPVRRRVAAMAAVAAATIVLPACLPTPADVRAAACGPLVGGAVPEDQGLPAPPVFDPSRPPVPGSFPAGYAMTTADPFTGDVTVWTNGDLDATRAAVVAYGVDMARVRVERSRRSRAGWDALAAEVLAAAPAGAAARIGPDVVLVDAPDLATAWILQARFGDSVSIDVGAKHFPSGRPGDTRTCLRDIGGWLLGGGVPPGISASVIVIDAVVPTGSTLRAGIIITNRSGADLLVSQPVAGCERAGAGAALTRRGSSYSANRVSAPSALVAERVTMIEPDNRPRSECLPVSPIRIPVGTTGGLVVPAVTLSAEADDNVHLPPGEYDLKVELDMNGSRAQLPPVRIRLTP